MINSEVIWNTIATGSVFSSGIWFVSYNIIQSPKIPIPITIAYIPRIIKRTIFLTFMMSKSTVGFIISVKLF